MERPDLILLKAERHVAPNPLTARRIFLLIGMHTNHCHLFMDCHDVSTPTLTPAAWYAAHKNVSQEI
jgi:hypothetical protein